MDPILLLLHITAVGLILMGLFHAVGKERRALFANYYLCTIVFTLSILIIC